MQGVVPGGAEVVRLLLVTLDSLRFDTAVQARTPFLDTLGPPRPATAHATFTLPAHVALFAGYPPRPADGRPSVLARLPQYARWGKRGSGARGTVSGDNLVDGLRRDGWHTVGAAGMRWFRTDQLRTGFGTFHDWGPSYTGEDRDLPAWASEDYALSHPGVLAQAVAGHDRWLLFVNAAETHAPYGAEGRLLADQRELASLRNGKETLPDTPGIRRLMADLHLAQQDALSAADARLGELFAALPHPFHYLVTADHGEAFGEGGLWGHVNAVEPVMTVPVWEGYAHA